MCSKHCRSSEKSLKTGGNGEVASVPLEDFFWKKNLPQKNCGSPSIFKMKVLEVYN